jgi:hypothetical protein
VISLKSRKTVLRENVFDELFNAVFIRFSKTDAKVQLTDRNRNEEFRFFKVICFFRDYNLFIK